MHSLARAITSEPSVEPVTLNEARDFMRVDYDDDDALIKELIKAARRHAENVTERAFINQTWTLGLDCFWGSSVLYLPRPPLSSVTSITYVDTDGNSQTVAASTYSVDTTHEPGRVWLAYGQTWPTPRAERNAVTVTYVAGYGAAASSVPETARIAIKMMVSDMYENRDVGFVGTIYAPNPTADRLLAQLRVPEPA